MQTLDDNLFDDTVVLDLYSHPTPQSLCSFSPQALASSRLLH
jgi:hypothetical protein